MRILGLGSRGESRVASGRPHSLLLRLGLGALAMGAMIGVAWSLADAGTSAEAAEGSATPVDYVPVPVSLVNEVSGVVETPLTGRIPKGTAAKLVSSLGGTVSDVADDTAGRIDPVTDHVLDTLACGGQAHVCTEDRPTGDGPIRAVTTDVTSVVRQSSALISDIARKTVDSPVDALPLMNATETSAQPVPGVFQDLTAALSPLFGALSATDATAVRGTDEAIQSESGLVADSLPLTSAHRTRTDTIDSGAAAAPRLSPVRVGAPHFPVISAKRAGQGLPGAPSGPMSAYLDLSCATGTSVSRGNSDDHHCDAVNSPVRAWFGESRSGHRPARDASVHPAQWVAEYAVVPD